MTLATLLRKGVSVATAAAVVCMLVPCGVFSLPESAYAGQEADEGQAQTVPLGLEAGDGVVQVAAGADHTAFLTASGKLYATGSNAYGQLSDRAQTSSLISIPQLIDDGVASVSCGSDFTAYITTTGDLYTFGHNNRGQLGNGKTVDTSAPQLVASNVASVSCGEAHMGYVTVSGDLYTCGFNAKGQLGVGTTVDTSIPMPVASNVASVSCGTDHSAYVATDGSLYTFGGNSYGQLGCGDNADSSVPKLVASNVSAVSCGANHTAYISDGRLYTCGYNGSGQLGCGTTADSSVFALVISNVASVSCGANHTVYATSKGAMYAFGRGTSGQLGCGDTSSQTSPVPVARYAVAEPDVKKKLTYTGDEQVAVTAPEGQSDYLLAGTLKATNAGKYSAKAMLNDPVNYQWKDGSSEAKTYDWVIAKATPVLSVNKSSLAGAVGKIASNAVSYNGDGRLSVSSAAASVATASITDGVVDVRGVSIGNAGITVSASEGANYASATVAFSIEVARSESVTTPLGLKDQAVAKAFASANMSAFITTTGELYAYGYNSYGQLGDGTTLSSLVSKLVKQNVKDASFGQSHMAYVTNDGVLYAVGCNSNGQLGDGTTTNSTSPVKVADSVASVACSSNYTAYVTASGDLRVCGVSLVPAPAEKENGIKLADTSQTGGDDPTEGGDEEPAKSALVASEVAQLVCGGSRGAYITTSGALYTFDVAAYSASVADSETEAPKPVLVASGVASASVSASHAAYITTGGELYTFGSNSYGQLGDGTTVSRTAPSQIATGVAGVSCGANHTAYVTAGGELYTCGANSYGQLGDDTTASRFTPQNVASQVASASCGSSTTAYVTAAGALYACGYNARGQLGDGTTSTRYTAQPIARLLVEVAGLDASHVYDGTEQSGPQEAAAYTLDGTLKAVNAGTYNFTAQLADTQSYQWKDGTSEAKELSWTIAKAAPTLSLAKESCSGYVDDTATNAVNYIGDGYLSVASLDTKIAKASLSSNTVKVMGLSRGEATITVTSSEGANYTSASASFTVSYVPRGANTVTVKASTKSCTVTKLATKKRSVSPLKVKKAIGKVTYAKVSGSKALTVSKTTGKVTVKKGTKTGIYKIKVKVTAAGDDKHASKSITKTVKVQVKPGAGKVTSIKAPGSGGLIFTWSKAKGATKVRVKLKSSKGSKTKSFSISAKGLKVKLPSSWRGKKVTVTITPYKKVSGVVLMGKAAKKSITLK